MVRNHYPLPLKTLKVFLRLPFRMLVRAYSAHVAFTPMIYAKHFIASEQCRLAEFTTCFGLF